VSRRRRRIPHTRANIWRREVAIGRHPVEAVCTALLEMPTHAGEVWSTGIAHDDGCLALRHGLRACDCEIVKLTARRVA
jgi:hypothetical protein